MIHHFACHDLRSKARRELRRVVLLDYAEEAGNVADVELGGGGFRACSRSSLQGTARTVEGGVGLMGAC